MARIDIRSNGGGGSVAEGVLQLQGGVAMSSTLTAVADQNDTTSPLKLSTTAVQVTSPLRITTSDASGFYLDAEDSATNNRFSIKRDPSSQEVTLDFASNPAGSTSLVGAIRTYQDGVNLSNAMSFIEDGSVGVGTNTPIGILHLKTSAKNTRLAIDGDAGFNKLISYRTAGLQRFGLYVNNTAESGSNAGSNFAIRAYSDAGTLLNTPVFIQRSTGNVGINTLTGTAKLQLVGSGSTSATTSLLVQNSLSTTTFSVNDAGELSLPSTAPKITLGGNLTIANTVSPTRQMVYDVSNGNLSIFSGGVGQGYFIGNRLTTSTASTTFVTPNGLNAEGSASITAYDGNGNIALNAANNGNRSIALKGLGASGAVLIGNITTGNGTSYSAILRADSTTQGFLPPRMTNAQRTAIGTPAVGLMVYCTDVVEGLYVYKSTGWTFVI
jgi:hypothetical protein